MNRKQTFKILQIFSLIFLLLVIGIIVTLLFQNIRKKDTNIYNKFDTLFGQLTSPITGNISQPIEVTSKIITSELLTTNLVYKIDSNSKFYPSAKLSQTIANQLELTLEQEENGQNLYFSNTQADTILSFNNEADHIYIGFFSDTEANADLTDESELEIVAKNKLQELSLWPYKENYSTSYEYYFLFGQEFSKVMSHDQANMISINFRQEITEIPLISNNINTGEIEIFIDSNKQVKKITYAYRPIDPDVIATYPIKSLDTALNEVENRKGELIIPFEGENPSSLTIREAAIAYRIEYKDQKYLQPVYIFEGNDNYEQIVTVIVPAVEDKYLINASYR